MKVDDELIDIKAMGDQQLLSFMSSKDISLKVNEARKIISLLGRNPTLTELYIFNTQWSEHSSYKSSRKILKKYLPTEGPTVILGPKEDAGIIYFTKHKGERYGIVISHESHNHPSQVVPYEGAATGIGGNVRDVLCMGAHVLASADPLRFGNPDGKHKERVKYVANAVVDGIAGYGNPLGVPTVAGDIYFSDSFDDNCLVNVVTIGLIKEKDIIHSSVPKGGIGYDIVVVGKATDNSGFGGAAFASLILDEKDQEANKGAVQVPDPFLKNVIIRATEQVFKEARKKNITLGFKDMGAGGIMCSTSELCSSADYGCVIDLDRVHVSMNIQPYMIACSETQERFTWISPPEFTPRILQIYNEEFDLPNVSEGAQASVIGKVTKEPNYILRYNGKIYCNAPVHAVTSGISYDREAKKPSRIFKEPDLKEPKNYNEAVLKVLRNPNVASKALAYKHYDTNVQGYTKIGPGMADAALIVPLAGSKAGVALKTDCNPKYSRINPFLGAVNAVAEAMRNVASIGAVPYGLTDCLNYGNPEKPEQFYDFVEGVKGLREAASNLWLKGTKKPVPFVSGNVSFYNESASGKSIDPSAIVACVGVMEDYSKAVTMKIKEKGSLLFLIGPRKDELGGSVYYEINGEIGANAPKIDYPGERARLYGIIDSVGRRLLLSCHDISDGGLITAVSEMILGGEADGKIGARINVDFTDLRIDKALFSESPGFVFEISKKNAGQMKRIFKKYNVQPIFLGTTGGDSLVATIDNKKKIDLPISKIKEAWTTGFVEAMK